MTEETKKEGLSKGQWRVGMNFNPSKIEMVNEIKKRSAGLIDLVDRVRRIAHKETDLVLKDETIRLCKLAQTCFEEGAMWGVKASTKHLK